MVFRKRLANCLRLVVAAAILLVPWSSHAMAQRLAAPADSHTVDIGANGFTFSPDPQSVAVGDTVHWVWDGLDHSTTSGSCDATSCTPDLLWNSGITNTGATFDFTFTSAGTYNYFCLVHGPLLNMRGTIIVVNKVYLPYVNR